MIEARSTDIISEMIRIFGGDKLLLLVFIKPHLDALWRTISQVSAFFRIWLLYGMK